MLKCCSPGALHQLCTQHTGLVSAAGGRLERCDSAQLRSLYRAMAALCTCPQQAWALSVVRQAKL